jgi:hypothetical protein
MEVDQNEVRTEFQGDVALTRLARIKYEPHWTYRAFQSARHTFELHRMQYIVHHALPTWHIVKKAKGVIGKTEAYTKRLSR